MQQGSGHHTVTQRQMQAKLGPEQALQHGRGPVSQLLIAANCFKMEVKCDFQDPITIFLISSTNCRKA